MEDKLQAFRQPIVTATGILLGFILNFAANWVKSDSAMPDWLAYHSHQVKPKALGVTGDFLFRLSRSTCFMDGANVRSSSQRVAA